MIKLHQIKLKYPKINECLQNLYFIKKLVNLINRHILALTYITIMQNVKNLGNSFMPLDNILYKHSYFNKYKVTYCTPRLK